MGDEPTADELDEQIPLAILAACFGEQHSEELLKVLQDKRTADDPVAVPVDVIKFADYDPVVTGAILQHPREGIARLQDAHVLAQQDLLEQQGETDDLVVKENVKIRLTGLPVDSNDAGIIGPQMADIRACHINDLVIVRGTVTHAGSVKVLERQRLYECNSCGHQFPVAACLETGFTVQPPTYCPGNEIKPCKGKTFRHMKEVQALSDYQEIRLQQKGSESSTSSGPRCIDVLLEYDLVDSCQPGDDVTVTAVVSQQWAPVFPGMRCNVKLCLHANNVSLENTRKAHVAVLPESAKMFSSFWHRHTGCSLAGRDQILGSICPELHGLTLVKLATILMLIGGVPLQQPDASRSDIHLLLVGDPGTGKSQIMRWAAAMSPRAVITSGRGSTAAGLTATAVRAAQDWTLEADEFNGLRDAAQTVMHEAMEQQTVSVAKAGLITSLDTRASVLAACNPKGRYDARSSLAANVKLGNPLLSRFDIVIVLRDVPVPSWDAQMADHVLGLTSKPEDSPELVWSTAIMKQYIAWVKSFEPRMGSEAEAVLLAYYQNQRNCHMRDAARTTARLLQSLIRISQAHARLMAREIVTLQDAVAAVLLVDASRLDNAIIDINPLQDLSDNDPDSYYDLLSETLLAKLEVKE